MSTDDMLAESKAAALIGWSYANLRNRRRQRIAATDAGQHSAAAKACPPFRVVRGAQGGDRIMYRRDDVLAWLDKHPAIADRKGVRARTMSQAEVCDLLGISRSTLRARRARRREGDTSAAPPHRMAGQEVRYRESDVRKWAKRVHWTLND